jgi:hypothetical protein
MEKECKEKKKREGNKRKKLKKIRKRYIRQRRENEASAKFTLTLYVERRTYEGRREHGQFPHGTHDNWA